MSARGDDVGLYDYYFKTDQLPLRDKLLRRRARVLLDIVGEVAPVASLLEIGPGFGLVADEARRRGIAYEAVESNALGAGMLRERGYLVHEAMVPPVPPLELDPDVALASHLIEHLPGPAAVVELLVALREALPPGGHVCLAFPDYLDRPSLFWDVDYTHTWPSTPRRVRNALGDAGFAVVSETALRGGMRGLPRALGFLPAHLPAPSRRLPYGADDVIHRGRLFFLREFVTVAQRR